MIQPNKNYQQLQLADKILDAIAVGCYVLNNNSIFTYINQKAEEILNIKRTDVLGKNVWDVFSKYVSTPYYSAINDTIKTKRPFTYEYLSPLTLTRITLAAMPLDDGALVTFTPMNEIKAFGFGLTEEQRRLEMVQKIGQIGYFEQRPGSEELYCSEELYKIHALTPINGFLPFEKFISCIHSDDQENYRKQLKEGLDRQRPFEVTNRIVRKDGELRVVHRRVEFLRNDHGTINCIYGTVQDITRQTSADLMLNSINEVCFQLDHDFHIIYANRKAYNTWQKEPADVIGKWIWDLFPQHLNSPFHEILINTIVEHKAMAAEAQCPVTKKWFYINANVSPAGLIVLHLDITEQVVLRQNAVADTRQDVEKLLLTPGELKKSNDLIRSVFDTSLIGISVLKAVRNENGKINDFSIMLANKALEKETGRTDLIGKWYTAEYPAIKKSGLFDKMLKVMETGKSEQVKYTYHHYGVEKWWLCMFVKMDDCLIATYLDITGYIQTEKESLKNLTILQRSEEFAQMGSCEYDLNTRTFTWSDGMYRLFGLPAGTKVNPEIYMQFVTENSQPIAQRIIMDLKSGTANLEGTLEISVNNTNRILKIKTVTITNEKGQAVKILWIHLDITSSKNTDERIRAMEERKRQEIFIATINTQEKERKRIAENLHNGIGQLLYAVKISLDQMVTDNTSQAAFDTTKKATIQLLEEAMKESRRISHELTPAILEDFGLQEAIKDVCQQFASSINIKCSFNGINQALDKYVEVSIYRIVQELVMNIVKHAHATEAGIEIELGKQIIMIVAFDNGIGINMEQSKGKGIGLQTIHNKVKLLRGSININNTKGTRVTIEIPYEMNIIAKP